MALLPKLSICEAAFSTIKARPTAARRYCWRIGIVRRRDRICARDDVWGELVHPIPKRQRAFVIA
jgi:hypothetical protein